MNEELSKSRNEDDGYTGLRKRLDEALVLLETVAQLRKDLRAEDMRAPAVGEGAFEELRAQVLGIVEDRQREGAHAFGLVINRVDLTERQVKAAMAANGLNGLAGGIVLRCLQKVLSRMHYAGLRKDQPIS